MHKLIILVEQVPDEDLFDEIWPQFLHLAERMPGLQQEATCRVEHLLFGSRPVFLVHELFFDTLADIQEAMSSPEGRAAGELLQRMSAGQLTLLIADHKQDDIDHIRTHQQAGQHGDTSA